MTTKVTSKLEVCQSLIQEHREMELLLDDLKQALTFPGDDIPEREAVEKVYLAMKRIEPEMNTHFACEEDALFPGVSPYHPMVLMEVEHEELIALRNGLLKLLGKKEWTTEDTGQMKEIGNRFIGEMLDHIGREDAGIFPTCENALSDEEKESIIDKMDCIRKAAALNQLKL